MIGIAFYPEMRILPGDKVQAQSYIYFTKSSKSSFKHESWVQIFGSISYPYTFYFVSI